MSSRLRTQEGAGPTGGVSSSPTVALRQRPKGTASSGTPLASEV